MIDATWRRRLTSKVYDADNTSDPYLGKTGPEACSSTTHLTLNTFQRAVRHIPTTTAPTHTTTSSSTMEDMAGGYGLCRSLSAATKVSGSLGGHQDNMVVSKSPTVVSKYLTVVFRYLEFSRRATVCGKALFKGFVIGDLC